MPSQATWFKEKKGFDDDAALFLPFWLIIIMNANAITEPATLTWPNL